MNLSDWQSALKSAEVTPDGFSAADLARACGISRRTARERLQSQIDKGRIVWVGFRTEMNNIGFPYQVPVYQWTKKGKVMSVRRRASTTVIKPTPTLRPEEGKLYWIKVYNSKPWTIACYLNKLWWTTNDGCWGAVKQFIPGPVPPEDK